MISSSLLKFLDELALHNHKERFHANRSWYDDVREEFVQFVGALIEGISEFDPSVTDLEPKQTLFRINKDIRFSKDKSPYKTNFGASISQGGRKSPYSGYYFHVQPGNHSFLAGGLYRPASDVLKVVREKLATDRKKLEKIVSEKGFVDAFERPLGSSLKTAPKGYPKDHPAIHRLRMKNIYVLHPLKDKQISSKQLLDHCIDTFKQQKAFNDFLNDAIAELEETS